MFMPRQRKRALDAYIGARLRLRRLMLGMSQEILATKLGLTFQQVHKYENGTNSISAGRLFDLAHALDVPVQYFFDGMDSPEDKSDRRGLQEDRNQMDAYFDFISSAPRYELNSAFLKIADEKARRHTVGMINDLARPRKDIET